ncbi:MAG: DUF3267 domain-containing protein [Chloroflexi bacterium]|nr:DUF3267 domain-containing protein [Chloroflexota bacterium]
MGASLPAEYIETGRWTVDDVSGRQKLVAAVFSLVAIAVTMGAASAVLSLTGADPGITIEIPQLLAAAVLGLVLHELSHAAAFLAFGGRPRFGAKAWTRLGPVLSVCAPGSYFGRGAYVFAGIGAVLVLGVLLLAVVAIAPAGGTASNIAIIAAVLNVAGGAGDAIIALAVLAYPSGARFEDTGEGFVVYAAAPVGDAD